MSKQWTSRYTGWVYDNVDPQKRGRCRLVVPEVFGHKKISGWARPMVVQAGGSGAFGKCDIPPVGATVWVRFFHGDENHPMYGDGWSPDPSGEYHLPERALGKVGSYAKGGTRVPSDPFAAEYPHNHVIQTKNGLLIEWDDTPEKQRINLQHPSGAYIEIHPDGKIAIRSPDTAYFSADGDVIITAGGNADVQAEHITLNPGPGVARLMDEVTVPHSHPGAGFVSAIGFISTSSTKSEAG